MQLPIYLDYAATTPIDPRVAKRMLEFLSSTENFANQASVSHSLGIQAKNAVEAAREQVAALINAEASEIIWTSGATESDNLALKGAANLYQRKGKHIVTVKTEHKAVLDSCQQLEKEGFTVTYLTPEPNGILDLNKLTAALQDDTILVSVMHVNNEIGVIQDIQAIGEITSARGILFHVDAAQSAGKIPIDTQKMPVDLLSLSAHKIYGPKGIGALYLRKKPRVRVAAQMHGGGHEQGMRSGTLATHQAVGMGEAFHLAKILMAHDTQHIQALHDQFWQGLRDLPGIHYHGAPEHSVPGIMNISFNAIKSDTLLAALPSIAAATGSACHSATVEPSYVLRALGLSETLMQSAIRFSFGRFTTKEEISFAIAQVSKYLMDSVR